MALGVGVPANEAGLSGNQPLTLRKSVTESVTDFGEICHRFWGNPFQFWGNASPILGKNMCLFWEKQAPFLGKTCSVFGKNMLRFGDEQAPFLGKTCSFFGKKHAPFLGRTGSVFWEKRFRFAGKLAWFLDWLGTKLKSHCFERKACLGLDF